MNLKLRKNLALAFTLIMLAFVSFAQEVKVDANDFIMSDAAQRSLDETGYIRCGSVEMDAFRKAKYPNMQTREEFENWLRPLMEAKRQEIELLSASASYMPPTINVPIIFHVITDGTMPSNISAAQIQEQIDQLNLDFNNMSGSAYPQAATADITFVPAVVDPAGNALAEIGVNRVTAYGAGPFPAGDFDVGGGGLEIKSTGWDYNLYANVWVAELTGGLLGYAQFPSNSTLPGLATDGGPSQNSGVVCGTGTIGSVASPGTAPPYNLGRTLTHEIGHWIGLRHIWGDGDCSVDDFCDDTPNASGSNFGCATGNDSCPADAGTDMVENYMDYSDDACMDTFTADQVLRILTVMDNADGLSNLGDSTTGTLDYSMLFANESMTDCAGGADPVFTFDYDAADTFTNTVNFTAASVPAGPTFAFSQNSANTDTNGITLTVSGATAGTYTITVTGTYGTEVKTKELTLTVYSAATAPTLTAPADGATDIIDHTMTWAADANAASYTVTVYSDAALTTVAEGPANVTDPTYTATTLMTETQYWWVVSSTNDCGTSANSGAFTFTTANIGCNTQNNNTQVAIPDNGGTADPATSTIDYTNGVTISDVNVTVNITHTWDADLTISLTSPAGTVVNLSVENGGSGDNYTSTIFDDDGADGAIGGGAAPFTGSFVPEQPLSTFNNEASLGVWTLTVSDSANLDPGTLDSWSLEICGSPLLDADGDGILDVDDNCPTVANADQADWNNNGIGDVCDDTDMDGIMDSDDNCIETPNAGQADWNGDGEGDACDDSDGDGIMDDVDNCVETANADQADWNNDGEGDVCDDTDGDGVVDASDNCIEEENADQADWNGNGIGDVCDDTDNDGIVDSEDNCIETANSDQADADNNGIGDVCDGVTPNDTITPNGDNINDTWGITNIDRYTQNGRTNTVKVFNRWGAKVYETSNYHNNSNNWNGESTEGGSGKLPVGSYYYIIELKEDSEVRTYDGWIYINY